MQIQLFQTEAFSKHQVNLLKESVRQRTQELVIDDGRGQFLDSSGKPLSYDEKTVLVLFPFLENLGWDLESLASILHVSESELAIEIRNAEEPVVFGGNSPYLLSGQQANQINELKIPGVYAVSRKYPPSGSPASQLIGITGENNLAFQKRYPDKKGKFNQKLGVTGLQQSFDEFLLPENESKLIYHVDGRGGPLFGIDVKYTGQGNPFLPLQVKTTINRTFQDEIEKLLDIHNVQKGGAILLDIETNEILAASSRPQINLKSPYSDEGTKNMMFEEHIPGSVFKTVVAAAALEQGLVNPTEMFNCSLDIRGEPAARDLGLLNMEESFSRSCNRTFAELAVRLMETDSNLLEEYSEKLGLLGSASWQGDLFHVKNFEQFENDSGRIFIDKDNSIDRNFVAQTGIGQHEVRVTPIAVANMMAAIARGGEKKSVRAASEIQYGNGASMIEFDEQRVNSGGQLSKYAAIKLQQLLRKVVTDEEGTGRAFQQLPYEVAGKSGTAETGVLKENKQLHHKWFAGYFPFQNPKYALVVLNMNVFSDEGGVTPLFSDIVNMIYEDNIR